ncbi:Predicted arabinose efflux permease, MFS family [Bradyrhizobium brasilense]|uniref:Predicted arabinose efflux permease, MFS family n=3 Tax=Bradyrhizobium brasilense TaxID=1419277 RepID=A0A1G7KXH5_9BRAD|nr:MFS transporter [Bradyrhizobium brasilense]SDF41801.1 Predicted arabinose efflux permease, MFS family [Bradyrhizobium brasilense]
MNLGWLSKLSAVERKTFFAAFGGLALDSMDTTIYALVTPALITTLSLSRPDAGILASSSLIGTALGGWVAGIAADRFGRVRVLQFTILLVAVSTFAAAFADGFWYLLVARAVQGMGYGGEAAVGAVLVAEVVSAGMRGRVAAAIQSGYAVGNALSVALFPVIFGWLSQDMAWRVFFAIGILPALLVFFVRRFVPESTIFVEEKAQRAASPTHSFWTIFTGEHLFKTLVATFFTTGTLGAAYVMITWLPTYLQTGLHLPVTHTAGYLAVNIFGSFVGPIAFGLIADRIGRRKGFMLFLVCQALNVVVYTQAPIGQGITIILGFFLGALQAGLASGLMPTFAELFPTSIRANGAGFALSAGRGLGSIVPATVGILSTRMHLGDAMAICAICGYTAAFCAALLLPEQQGIDLRTMAAGGAPDGAERLPHERETGHPNNIRNGVATQ